MGGGGGEDPAPNPRPWPYRCPGRHGVVGKNNNTQPRGKDPEQPHLADELVAHRLVQLLNHVLDRHA